MVLKPAALTESMYASVGNLLPQPVGFPGTSIVFPMLMPNPIFANISFAVGSVSACTGETPADNETIEKEAATAAVRRMLLSINNPLGKRMQPLFKQPS